jgi:hypothetical protein
MSNESNSTSIDAGKSSVPRAAALIGEARLELERLSRRSVSGLTSRRLRYLAEGLGALVEPMAKIERVAMENRA